MGIVTVDHLRPDMILAHDLKGSNGRFLLAKGTSLTERHLRTLRMWGIMEVDIEGISEDDLVADVPFCIDPLVLKAAEKLTRTRFAHCSPAFAVNRELFRLCALRKADEIVKSDEKKVPQILRGAHATEMDEEERLFSQISPAQLVDENVTLSTLPIIIAQINETINNPRSTAKDIANVISRDASLSARLLMIVNSPFYGFPSRIDSLSRAVLVVGTKQLGALALGLKIIRYFSKIPCDLIDMKSFLEHSLASAIVSRILAGYKNIQNIERLFAGGLLHDIGRLILYNQRPVEARYLLLEAKRTGGLLYKIEQDVLGCDHSRIGGALLKNWKLPVSLENMVVYHHCPDKSKAPLEPMIIYLADILVNAFGVGSSGERFVPPLEPAVWENIGLSSNILGLVIKQLDHQFEELYSFLLSDHS